MHRKPNTLIKGLFVSPQRGRTVWARDFESSPFYQDLKANGVQIDVENDMFMMRKDKPLHRRYDFALTEEVWLPKVHSRLLHIRGQGKRVFLISKEPFKTEIAEKAYFFHRRWVYDDKYFFVPDAVFAPGRLLADWWKKYTTSNVYVTGYPRFDYYCDSVPKVTKETIIERYGLEPDKKIIFFASYEPYIYVEEGDGIDPDIKQMENTKSVNDVGYLMDLWEPREATLQALEKFAQQNPEYQVVAKIHPMSFKCYKNGNGLGNEVSGTLLKYYENPTPYMKVIGDDLGSGADMAKELLTVSDVVTGWCSTMLLEAMLLKKPVVHILFGKTARMNGFPEYEEIFNTARSPEELYKFIKSPSVGYDEKLIEKYLHKLDGGTFARIADAIRQEICEERKTPIVRPEMIPENMRIEKKEQPCSEEEK